MRISALQLLLERFTAGKSKIVVQELESYLASEKLTKATDATSEVYRCMYGLGFRKPKIALGKEHAFVRSSSLAEPRPKAPQPVASEVPEWLMNHKPPCALVKLEPANLEPSNQFPDGQKRIPLATLVQFLGYTNQGRMADVVNGNRAHLGTIETDPAGRQWVTQEQACLLTIRSGSPKAIEQTMHIVKVFCSKADRGMPSELMNDPFIQLRISQIETTARVDALAVSHKALALEQARQAEVLEYLPNYFTAMGFVNYKRRRDVDPQRLGSRACKLLRDRGQYTLRKEVADQRFGVVGSYPRDVLEEALTSLSEEH